jgi:pyoluteorin transport system permease protein
VNDKPLINPLRYAIDIIHRIYLEGVGLKIVVPELWPLALIGAVTLSAAAWMFRNRLERRILEPWNEGG